MECYEKKLRLLKKLDLDNIEEYFFSYAFPCVHTLREFGRITKERYEFILEDFEKGEIPSKEELEDIFTAAFRRLKLIAKERGKDYWDPEIVKDYWRVLHNKFIDEKDGTYAMTSKEFNELCKVHEAIVLFVGDNEIVVEYNNTRRKVLKDLIPDVEVGDKVTIHLNYAVEKLE